MCRVVFAVSLCLVLTVFRTQCYDSAQRRRHSSRQDHTKSLSSFVQGNYVVHAMDENMPYTFFAPLLTMLWQSMGFNPVFLCYNIDNRILDRPRSDRLTHIVQAAQAYGAELVFLPPIKGYVKGVPEMTSRYFACSLDFDPRAYIMLSDMDMLPLQRSFYEKRSSFKNVVTLWNAFAGAENVHGSCYIGMTCAMWRNLMGIHNDGHYSPSKLINDVSQRLKVDRLGDQEPSTQWAYDQKMFTRIIQSWSRNYTNGRVNIVDRSAYRRLDRGSDFWLFDGDNGTYAECHTARPVHHGTYQKVWDQVLKIVDPVMDDVDRKEIRKWFNAFINLPETGIASSKVWS